MLNDLISPVTDRKLRVLRYLQELIDTKYEVDSIFK